MTADVLVAGGGPAGAAAAMTCRAAGLTVALAAPPPSPGQEIAPWETLHPEALALLDLLGAHDIVAGASIGRMGSFKAGHERRRLASGPRPAWHVDRKRFDALLLARAAAAGVEVLCAGLTSGRNSADGISARLSSGAAVDARWMIDATGRRRIGSRLIGGQYRRLSPALVSRTALRPRQGKGSKSTEFSAYPWGWTWVTGAHDGRCTWTAVHAARDDPPDEISELLAGSASGSLHTASATWFRTEISAAAPVLPVGDAAGSLDPASGLGMTNALASGLAAGKTVALCLAQRAASERLTARYHNWWADRLEEQARQLRRLYDESGIRLA